MRKNHYFESVGAWPENEKHLVRTYAMGFVWSLVLTLVAYVLAVQQVLSATLLVPVLLALACIQLFVQVIYFLHVSGDWSSRNRLVILLCTGAIMFILVIGSMWIMTTLDARMMPSSHMETYMERELGM